MVQRISVSPNIVTSPIKVTSDREFSVDIFYSSDDSSLSGFSLQMFYDSAQLDLLSVQDIYLNERTSSGSSPLTKGDDLVITTENTLVTDGDPATNVAFVQTWFVAPDPQTGEYLWTGTDTNTTPQKLYTATFKIADTVDIATTEPVLTFKPVTGTDENGKQTSEVPNNGDPIFLDISGINTPPLFTAVNPVDLVQRSTGDVVTVVANDADADPLTYSLLDAGNTDVDGNGQKAFAIDTATGKITVNDSGDLLFSNAQDATNQFTLTVAASDGLESSTTTVTVNITNAAPTFGAIPTLNVKETDPATTEIGVISANPVDGDTLTYSLVDPSPVFDLDTTGKLTVKDQTALAALVAGTSVDKTVTVKVKATDPFGASAETDVNILIENINDAPVFGAFGPFTIKENTANNQNSPVNTSVGQPVTATDADGDALTYSILGGNTGDAFAIDQVTGQITVNTASALNFETLSQYVLTVQADDGKDAANSKTTTSVTINLENDPSDDNTAPTFNGAIFSILENLPNDTVVGTLDVTDVEDAIGDLKLEIMGGNSDIDGDGNSPFKVAFNGTSWEILVNDSGDLNYEQIESFNLTVKATDTFGASTEANILINLEDVEIELIDNTNVIDIVEQNLRVGAGQTLTLNIQNVTSNAVFNNSLTFYRIDSADGGIDADGNGTIDFMPGDAGYLAQALSRIENPDNLIKGQGEGTTGTGAGNFVFTNTSDNTVYYAPILLANAGGLENLNDFLELNAANEIDDQSDIAAYFLFEEANAKYEGVISDSRFAWDGQSLRVEDLHSGFSDNDFNDLVFDSNL